MLMGFVEYIGELYLSGWVCDTDTPGKHLAVHVYLNSEKIGETKASMYRSDIEAVGLSDGWSGFSFNFPSEMDSDSIKAVTVFTVDSAGAQSPLKILKAAEAEAPRPPQDSLALPQQPFDFSPQDEAPIFILGAARSGTTAIARALNICLGHEGVPEEGHFLPLLSDLSTTIASFYESRGEELNRNTLIQRIPIALTIRAVEQTIKYLVKSIMAAPVWVDKTPGSRMLDLAPKLLRIWPKARFIFMRRRALDNLASRKRHFPEFKLLEHCQEWTNIMHRWRSLRELLGESCIEVDQYDLMANSVATTERLARFLGLSECETITLSLSLQVFQPQRTTEEWGKLESLEKLDWSKEEKDSFIRICGTEMEEYGYTYDESYFA